MIRLILLFLAACVPAAFGLTIESLRCESVSNPLGVDVPRPRLSWVLASNERAEKQTAYQVLATSTKANLDADKGDLWDSGKVTSDNTIQIPYSGAEMKSSQQVFWKVRAWDKSGKPSEWSSTGAWTMGVLHESDWRAKWIGMAEVTKTAFDSSLMLRHDFTVKKGLRRALVHVCGLGCYEMSINGGKVGDCLFPPGWTKYNKTCLYDTYDITKLLRAGNNAAGLILGNGMYNVEGRRYEKFKGTFGVPKAIAELVLEYQDGTMEIIGTDGKWKTALGPVTFSSVYGGEDYDARLEPSGWNQLGFNDAKWASAIVSDGPGGKLKGLSCSAPPIRSFDVFKPVETKELRPGVTVYDLGQNASMMPRIRVKGPAGAVVKMIPAELVKEDGSVDRGSVGGRECWWQYTLKGGGSESWFPKFFYHGCRYVQVECVAPEGGKLPVVESLVGVVVHSSSEAAGEFSCSNELFNRIHTLIRWAQRSNMMSVLTDCPHRERLGWLEQDHLNGPSLRYEFGLDQLFTKIMNDMADSQLESGLVPSIAPEYVAFGGATRNAFGDSPEWGSAFLLVPWQQYEWTGDTELLGRYYDDMKRYVAYLGSRSKEHILSYGLGDWYDIGPKRPGKAQLTPVALTATAFYYADVDIMAKTAQLLGKSEDAKKYEALAGEIREAFNKEFFNAETGQYSTGSQCANAIPLVMNLVDSEHRQSVLDAIVKDVRDRGNGLTAGDIGYRYLLRALADGGRSDVIFDMNNQSDKPGYGLQLAKGATSLAEAWDASPRSSQNHFMLGQIMEWFYHDVAGISCASDGAGFKKIIIKPAIVGDLSWVKAGYDSVHGRIETQWKRDKGQLTLDVTIPANTTATVYVPAEDAASVTESGKLPKDSEGVTFLREESGFAVYETGSGNYSFTSSLPSSTTATP